MMKIHTTQDLSNLAQYKSTNSVSSKEFRCTQEKAKLRSNISDYYTSTVSFGKKKPPSTENVKKVIKKTVSKVGDIKKQAEPEYMKGDGILDSKVFDVMLTLAENEPVIQAAMSALICIGLRPITIMALPNKKGKQDNMYAASHSIASGTVGLASALIIAQPFKSGSSYLMKNMYKNLDIKTLERLNPHLDLKSIVDSNKKRKPEDEWLDKAGNKFSRAFKDVDKIPALKLFNNISEESFKAFGADVDWAAQKGKSFNEVVTKDGKSLYDAIDWTRVGIVIENNGIGEMKNGVKANETAFLIKDLDKDFFRSVLEDAEETSPWKQLDIESVYKDGKVQDFRKWKDLKGDQWKLDLDSAYISSPYDTADYKPRVSGRIRKESDDVYKYATYFKNGKNGELGTEITKELYEADKANEVLDKILTWLPDIISRPVVASATIALIPLALSKVFHLEKPKKEEPNVNKEIVANKEESNEQKTEQAVSFKGRSHVEPSDENKQNDISFKGKGGEKGHTVLSKLWEKFVAKPLAKIYAKPVYESETAHNVAKKLSNIPGKMTTHMATLGSLITSSVYMQQTLTKKDLDSDRRRTLAINQGLCFVIPTICAYTVDSLLNSLIKKKEYRYSGKQEQKIAKAELEGMDEKHIKSIQESLGKKLKGVRIIAGLATFSLIYRYVTPVIITPIANRIGDYINDKRKEKAIQKSAKKAE